MPGPAPKHPSTRARRNNAKADFTTLPAAGRQGDVPTWPLAPDVVLSTQRDVLSARVDEAEQRLADAEDGRTKAAARRDRQKALNSLALVESQLKRLEMDEESLWAELWSYPQAVEWERSHAFRAVALYVRNQVKAEMGDSKAAGEARQWSDRLGLNPLALMRLRQEIEATDSAEEKGNERRQKRRPAPTPQAGEGDDPRAALRAV